MPSSTRTNVLITIVLVRKRTPDAFENFRKRIKWKARVKAICKPCWELKYCPYGPLVEEFPLKEEQDSQSCRIFGHDCPVFYVAEPFTETKELRNVSRNIPRPVQFRVLKRENQICSICGRSVQDADIHFDHIIPRSKGGSSDEHNIRLLCDECNQRRSNRFEAEYLVANAGEHNASPSKLDLVPILILAFEFAHSFRKKNNRFPNAAEVAEEFAGRAPTLFEQLLSETFDDFQKFFKGVRPTEMTRKQFGALADRWGYYDGEIYKLCQAAEKCKEPIRELVILERSLLGRSGWYIDDSKLSLKKWEKL
jgi:hypothetical protein